MKIFQGHMFEARRCSDSTRGSSLRDVNRIQCSRIRFPLSPFLPPNPPTYPPPINLINLLWIWIYYRATCLKPEGVVIPHEARVYAMLIKSSTLECDSLSPPPCFPPTTQLKSKLCFTQNMIYFEFLIWISCRATCLKPEGVVIPHEARVYAMLIESSALECDSFLTDDEKTCDFQIARHINDFRVRCPYNFNTEI